MADGVAITAGSGTTISTDDAGASGHVQRVKLAYSSDGSATHVTADADGLLVNLGSNNDVTVTGTVTVQDGGNVISVDDGSGSLTIDNAALSVTGGGVEASALRVTLASDSTGVVSVDDNGSTLSIDDGGGTITVDGTVAVSGTVTVGSHAVTNAGTFAVQVDGSALTSLQLIDDTVFAEDAAHTTGDKGIQALAVRNDSDASLAGTSGDYTPLQVDSSGYLKVNVKAGSGTGGTSATDDSAFTPASGLGTPIMGFADETSPDAVDEGDVGVVRMTLSRGLHVNLRDASGAEVSVGGGTQYDEDTAHVSGDKVTMAGVVRADTAAAQSGTDGDRTVLITDASGRLHVNVGNTVTVGSHAVTNAGTFVVQENGAALTALQLIDNIVRTEDEASADGHSGAVVLFRRTATPANTSGTDLDYEVPQMSAGRVWVSATVDAALPAGTNNIGDVDVLSVVPGTGATALGKAEDAAHSSGDTGVSILARRIDTPAASAGTSGDYTTVDASAEGALWVTNTPTTTGGLSIFRSLDLDETEEEVKATAGNVYTLWFTNTATSTRFLKFYNATAANVTVGSTTPVLTLGLPGNSSDDISGVFSSAHGFGFGTAITVAATTGAADNDTGAPGANEVIVNIGYK